MQRQEKAAVENNDISKESQQVCHGLYKWTKKTGVTGSREFQDQQLFFFPKAIQTKDKEGKKLPSNNCSL